jgi:hypothetical protein
MSARRNLPVTAVILLVVLAATGCGYKIFVKTVVSPEAPAPLEPGAAIHIQESAGLEGWGEVSTAGKIEGLLEEHGYGVTDSSEADFLLFYDYSKDAMLGKKQVEPLSGGASGVHSVRKEGPYLHRLTISVVSAEPYLTRKESEVVWAGGAVTELTSLHSPKTLDLLLVAVFDRFSTDTGETLDLRMNLNNPRAARLREP